MARYAEDSQYNYVHCKNPGCPHPGAEYMDLKSPEDAAAATASAEEDMKQRVCQDGRGPVEVDGINERRVRQVVRHLIDDHGYAIGSATTPPAGYYLIDDKAELDQHCDRMLHRATQYESTRERG
jgi:hypothetical protein